MKKELIFNLLFTIITSIIVFIQNKIFIKYIGIEIFGIMKLFTQLLQYLNIMELGLGSASTFALYKPLIENNQEQISIIVSTIKSIYNKIAITILSLGVILTPFLPYLMKIEKFEKTIYFYWILYLVNTVSTYLYIKYVVLFTANQEFLYIRTIQSMSKVFYQILQILLIVIYKSFIIFIFLLLLDNLTQYIFFKFHYNKKYSYIYKTKEKYIEIKKDMKNLFCHKIAGLIVFNTDMILIAKLISLDVVGIYASYQLIIQIGVLLIATIINVLKPKIGKSIVIKDKQVIFVQFKSLNIIFMVGSLFFVYNFYFLINIFINLWLENIRTFELKTVLFLSINVFILMFRHNLDMFKENYGFFDDVQVPIFEAVINLVFSIILGIKYGLDGIIMGTIISNILVIMIYKPILVFKRCFDKGVKEYIKIYGNYLILLIISLILLNIATKPFIRTDINTWIDWIIYATTISVITGVVLFIVFLLNKEFRNIIKIYVLKRK